MTRAVFAAVIFFPLAWLSAASPARAADFAKQKAIVELMEITGVKKMLPRMARRATGGIIESLRRANPQLDARAAAIVRDEMTKAITKQTPAMLAHIVTIYEKHFSEKEIRDIIAFYQTETGKKTLHLMPRLARDLAIANMKILRSMMPELNLRIRQRLRREGHLPSG